MTYIVSSGALNSTHSLTHSPYKVAKILAIWQHNKRFWAFIPCACAKTPITSFRSKIWPRHSLRRRRFPIRQMHFHYRVTFTWYIRCFCATTSHDLVTLTFDLWPFDLESVSCTVLLVSDPRTNFYYPTTVGYWVTRTEYLFTFPLSETVTAHAPCHVTSDRGQK